MAAAGPPEALPGTDTGSVESREVAYKAGDKALDLAAAMSADSEDEDLRR
jgi:hypothetical protein